MAKHIHIVGIGGISLSALAVILIDRGYSVSGSDTCKNELTQKLECMGAKIYDCHRVENVIGADLVVYSVAVKDDNVELQFARANGIETINRQTLLGKIAGTFDHVIGIAGSHGKTTTTGMIATVFLLSGLNPTIHIGGYLPAIGGNVCVGSNEFFITEACEYYDSFLSLSCDVSVILNIQKDHMDYFKNMSNLQKSFEKFAKNTKYSGVVVANFDDENCKKIKQKSIVSYGLNCQNLFAKNISQTNEKYSFDVVYFGKTLGRICMSVVGKHNIYNALATIAVCLHFDIEFEKIKAGIERYVPSKRRYQEVILQNRVAVVHDYAHHPTEILASIQTAKKRTAGKLIVVFEPHTFSRTQYLWAEFCESFFDADMVFLPPIYPARENPIDGISSENLAKSLKQKGVSATSTASLNETYNLLQEYLQPDNTILLLGAGTIVHLAQMFGIE